MSEFKVRFAPSIPGALGILWAALTGKMVALVVAGPFRIEQDGSVFTVYRTNTAAGSGGENG